MQIRSKEIKMKKLSLIATLLLASTTAAADPFYINVGTDFGGNDGSQADGATTTGWLSEMQFKYESDSVITDADGSFSLTVGDTISSTGGVLRTDFAADWGSNYLDGLANNQFTSLLPGSIGGTSHNGFNSFSNAWGLTLGFDNVEGVITDVDSSGTATIAYNSGTISLYYYDDVAGAPTSNSDLVRLYDFTITQGGDGYNGVVGTGLDGMMGNSNMSECLNGVATTDPTCVFAGDLLNLAFGGSVLTGSEAEALAQADPSFQFGSFVITDTEQVGNVQFDPQGQFLISGSHDGSITFNVPEPGTLGLFGLALLGVAGFARRK